MKSIRKIVIELPAEVDDTGLFEAVCDAVHDWEPEERDGWDVDVTGTVVQRPNAEEIDEIAGKVEQWLDNLDLSAVKVDDLEDIREIRDLADRYARTGRWLVQAIERARTNGRPEWWVGLVATVDPEPKN